MRHNVANSTRSKEHLGCNCYHTTKETWLHHQLLMLPINTTAVHHRPDQDMQSPFKLKGRQIAVSDESTLPLKIAWILLLPTAERQCCAMTPKLTFQAVLVHKVANCENEKFSASFLPFLSELHCRCCAGNANSTSPESLFSRTCFSSSKTKFHRILS